MNISKKFISVLLCITMMFIMYSMPVHAQNDDSIMISWANIFSSFDEMVNSSDIVVYGTIVSQEELLLDDGLVYTKSTVMIESIYKGVVDSTIYIFQIGGSNELKSTPYPTELPKLKMGTPMVFLCTGENSVYFISGAGQGYFENIAFNNWNEALDDCESKFIAPSNTHTTLRAIPETPTNGMNFSRDVSTIYYYFNTDDIGLSATYIDSIIRGLKVWDPYIPANIAESNTATGPCVTINVSNSAPSGNNYLAVTVKHDVYSRKIIFYRPRIVNQGYNTTYYWSKIAMHEMGHAIGLGHSPSTDSAMYYAMSVSADRPSNRDIETLQSLYY